MEEITFNVKGLKIAAKTWGDPQKKPVLALHGWLDNAASFDFLAPLLTEKYYIVALDLPGHGHSAHLPAHGVYHFIDGVVHVQQLVEHLQWKKYSLLGHSMGSGIASLLAGVTPDAIENGWFIEVLGALSRPENAVVSHLQNYFENIKHLKSPHFYPTFEDAVQARMKAGHVNYDTAAALASRSVTNVDGQFHWRHDARLVLPSPMYLTEGQVLAFLEKITAPCCYFVAEHGFPFPPEVIAQRCAAIPHLKKFTIPGGHHCHMEHPQAIADVLLKASITA